MTHARLDWAPSPQLLSALRVTALVGGLIFLLGLFIDPQRAWGGYLMGFLIFVELGLAGALFVCVLTLASASWGTALRRIPEAMSSTLPVAAALGLFLLGGVHSLYEWSHAGVVEGDPLLLGKAGYLNFGFFSVRIVLYFALWIVLSFRMTQASRDQDADGDPTHSRRRLMAACVFLPVFAITFSLASVDWIQSLEPHWFSTIYGLITLSSLGCLGLAVCILLAAHLGRGPLRGIVRDEHMDDLGKIGIGFALFWGYIWYCQYMLIWYTDMPEETMYYALRDRDPWKVISWVNVTLNWGIPFFALMPRFVRRRRSMLVRIAWVMILGQCVNLYLLVQPALMGTEAVLGIWEVAPVCGALALFFFGTLRALGSTGLVPMKDPTLAASLEYHA